MDLKKVSGFQILTGAFCVASLGFIASDVASATLTGAYNGHSVIGGLMGVAALACYGMSKIETQESLQARANSDTTPKTTPRSPS
jgi:hypothetical protein